MTDSPNLSLPYLASAQAQKHVTVNEALSRLDALSAPVAKSAAATAPPADPADGELWIVPAGATGAWSGADRQLAFFVNDGWAFADPRPGWRVWVEDESRAAVYVGGSWIRDLLGPSAFGAHMFAGFVTGEEVLSGPGAHACVTTIPDRAVVLGVTARVTEAMTGNGLTHWRLGVVGAGNRYGDNIGLALNSTVVGVTSEPVAYFADTPLQIVPSGGPFDTGRVRLAIHYFSVTPPDAV